MLDDSLIKSIEATGEVLDLDEAVIEKDYYVTQVIHTLSDVENDYFRLVFAGGTCLAKAHKIVKRMSEDVDFKVQVINAQNFSKTKLLKELKEFRTHIQSRLELSGLNVGEPKVRNEGKYLYIEVNYPIVFPSHAGLRPHILLEFTVSDVHLSIENLFIRTLIEETLGQEILFSDLNTQCISVEETAIEKFIGLTRRIMAIERGYHDDDKALIRHIYDLNAMKNMGKITDKFFELARTIVNRDSKQFKNQHPEFAEDPIAEINNSLAILKNKSQWEKRYQEFVETMVYDDTPAVGYEKALNELNILSKRVVNSLNAIAV